MLIDLFITQIAFRVNYDHTSLGMVFFACHFTFLSFHSVLFNYPRYCALNRFKTERIDHNI